MKIHIEIDGLSILSFFLCTGLLLFAVYKAFQQKISTEFKNLWSKVHTAAVEIVASGITMTLAQPEVHDALTNLISKGITRWVESDGYKQADQLMLKKNQKLVAQELGKQIPGLVGSFSKGVVDSFNPFKKGHKRDPGQYSSSDHGLSSRSTRSNSHVINGKNVTTEGYGAATSASEPCIRRNAKSATRLSSLNKVDGEEEIADKDKVLRSISNN